MARQWAICIGINEYDNLRSLSYSQNDAECVRDFCSNEAGFERTYFFAKDAPLIETDNGSPLRSNTTYGVLMNFFHRRFQIPFLNLSDDLWLFFAGHGRRYQGEDYLMLSDSNPHDIEKTAIPIQYITQRLRNSGAGNIVLLFDACRDLGDRSDIGIGSETYKGFISFYSCSPSESSYEIEALSQGSFTYCLLQGLRGYYTTVKRLDDYLRDRVPTLNQQYQKPKQTPCTSLESITQQNLILLPRRAQAKDVATFKLDAYKAEVSGDYALAEQLWSRVLMALPADQDAISAIKRIGREVAPAPSNSNVLPQPQRAPLVSQLTQPESLHTDQPDLAMAAFQKAAFEELKSARAISYNRLQNLLQSGQWQQANQETEQLMLKVARRKREGWLNSESIHHFPSIDLRTIDQLWMEYSAGRFGFSVQKQIFEAAKCQESQFMETVDWEVGALYGGVVSSEQNSAHLKFELTAPAGHMPMVFGGEHGWIFERLK